MIGDIKTGATDATISAVAHEGLTITLPDGRPGRLAIVDADGRIVEVGEHVAREAWNVAIESYKNLLRGMGHLRTIKTASCAGKPENKGQTAA